MIPEITREQKVPNNGNPLQEKEHTQIKRECVRQFNQKLKSPIAIGTHFRSKPK